MLVPMKRGGAKIAGKITETSNPYLTFTSYTASCMHESDISNSRCTVSRAKSRDGARRTHDAGSHHRSLRAMATAKKQIAPVAPTVDWLNFPAPLAHLVSEDIAEYDTDDMRKSITQHWNEQA